MTGLEALLTQRSGDMAFRFDHADDVVHVLLADFVGFRFHHDPDDRFGAAFAHQNPPGIAERRGDLLNRGLY